MIKIISSKITLITLLTPLLLLGLVSVATLTQNLSAAGRESLPVIADKYKSSSDTSEEEQEEKDPDTQQLNTLRTAAHIYMTPMTEGTARNSADTLVKVRLQLKRVHEIFGRDWRHAAQLLLYFVKLSYANGVQYLFKAIDEIARDRGGIAKVHIPEHQYKWNIIAGRYGQEALRIAASQNQKIFSLLHAYLTKVAYEITPNASTRITLIKDVLDASSALFSAIHSLQHFSDDQAVTITIEQLTLSGGLGDYKERIDEGTHGPDTQRYVSIIISGLAHATPAVKRVLKDEKEEQRRKDEKREEDTKLRMAAIAQERIKTREFDYKAAYDRDRTEREIKEAEADQRLKKKRDAYAQYVLAVDKRKKRATKKPKLRATTSTSSSSSSHSLSPSSLATQLSKLSIAPV